jgi:hypothetical protein
MAAVKSICCIGAGYVGKNNWIQFIHKDNFF